MRRAALVLLAGCWTGSPSAPPAPRVSDEAPSTATVLALVDPAQLVARVDPAYGLVVLDAFLEPGEPPGTTSERHLCGDAFAVFTRDEWHEVADAITAARTNHSLACNGLACRAGGRGEWDPVYHFDFVRSAGRLVLRSVSYDDEVLRDAAEVSAEHAKQRRLVGTLAVACK